MPHTTRRTNASQVVKESLPEGGLKAREPSEEADAILSALHDVVLIYDAQRNVIRANAAFAAAHGFDPVGLNLRDVMARVNCRMLDGRALELEDQPTPRALRGERVEGATYRVNRSDGSEKIVETSSSPLHRNGDIVGSVTVWHDITERKHIESELKEAEQKANDLIRYAPTAIYEIDFRGPRFIRVNDAMCEMSGFTREELLTMGPLGLLDDESRQAFQVRVSQTLAGESIDESVEYKVKTKEGRERYALLKTRPLYAGGKPIGAFVIAQDITERKRTEEALRGSEERYRSLADNVPCVLMRFDRDLRVMYLSARSDEYNPVPRRELLGKTNREMGMPLHLCDLWERATHEVFDTGEPRHVEFDFESLQGPRSFYLTFAPEFGADGTVEYVLGVSTDITERKQAEEQREKLARDLERRAFELAVINKELESFTYAVAHDLRGPINQVDQLAHLMLEEHSAQLTESGRHLLHLIRENAAAVNRLAEDMLTLARLTQQSPLRQTVSMNDLVRQVLKQLVPTSTSGSPPVFAGKPVDIKVGDLPSAEVDPAWIIQVWEHLIANALKFTRTRQTPHIEVGAVEEPCQTVYWVSDNGVGFNMAHAGRLFRAFQRLHHAEEFEGNGLGLAIVDRIIRCHGGRVWAEARVDGGATFYFTLTPH